MSPAPIRRRRVLSTAAWAAPAATLITTAPALAATPGGGCTTLYPFTVSGIKASWTNTTSAPITLTYVTSVPLSSVFNTNVTQVASGGAPDTIAYTPNNATTYTFSNGGSLTSTAATTSGGSMTWTATVTVPTGSTLTLGTQAGNCKAAAPSATVQVTAPHLDCPFTYPVDCPF